MNREKPIRLVGAALFAVLFLVGAGSVWAGTVDIAHAQRAAVDVASPMQLGVVEPGVAIFDAAPFGSPGAGIPHGAAFTPLQFGDYPISAGGGTPTFPQMGPGTGIRNGDALLRDTVGFGDVPLPPALLLFSTAILGLVTVARRDNN